MLFFRYSLLPLKIFLFGLLVLAISGLMCFILTKTAGRIPTVLGTILAVAIAFGLTAVWVGLTFA